VIDAAELTVQLSTGRGCARLPILRRAVAATSAKANLPVDRIDDAVLILEALLADTRTANTEDLHFVLTARPGSFALLMGPLAGDEAERLLAHAALPLVGPVIERLATTAITVDGGSHLLIVVDAA
jgi:serine/threonine-protein kinase RsbW